MRIAIAGAPRAGKTTLGSSLARELGVPLQSTDDLIAGNDWSAASSKAARWLLAPGPYVVEGVAVVRALRKALDADDARPCDRLLWLDRPHRALSAGQRRMFDADAARLREIEAELLARGVEIVRESGAASVPPKQTSTGTELPEHETPRALDHDPWGRGMGRGFG